MSDRAWRRKWQADLATGGWSPMPERVVSNEEYVPLGQTAEQARVAAIVRERSEHHARALGIGRREFLGSALGMATALLAMNDVFGRFFDVDPAEALEVAGDRAPVDPFILDAQTHYVSVPGRFPEFLTTRLQGRRAMPNPVKERAQTADLSLETYIKEVFLDSDTTVAVLSGVPVPGRGTDALPPGAIAATRDVVNRLAASERVVAHGAVAPAAGAPDRDAMQRQVEQLGVRAWKAFTGIGGGSSSRGWRLDDERVSYPMLETARRLGVTTVCLHKGLPLKGTAEEYWHPRDVERAAKDFPDISFVVYHAAFKSLLASVPDALDGFRRSARVNWVTDLCDMRRRNPEMRNVYVEIGSTFGMLAITSPLLTGHVLGMLIDAYGADHVLWGTDSIWWGSPQWQIEAFRRFEIPETLIERFGYRPLTPEVKRDIFGLNAAPLFGVDPTRRRDRVPDDFITRLKGAYRERGSVPSLTQYGWVAGS